MFIAEASKAEVYKIIDDGDVQEIESHVRNIDIAEHDLISYCITTENDTAFTTLLRHLPEDKEQAREIINAPLRSGVYETFAPLHIAAGMCNLYACRMLIERGADVNQITRGDLTPIFCLGEMAMDRAYSPQIVNPILDLLIESGANLKLKTQYDRTISMIYASKEYYPILDHLLQSSLKDKKLLEFLLNEEDEFGDRLLHHACKSQTQRVFKYRFSDYSPASFQTVYTCCLFPVDLRLENLQDDEGLDVIFLEFADLMEFVAKWSEVFRASFPDLDELLHEKPTSLKLKKMLSESDLNTFLKLRKSWNDKLDQLEADMEVLGACPVVNISNKPPVRSRRSEKIGEDSDSESDSEDEGDNDVATPASKVETKAINSAPVASKCPFGYTSESGVPNPHQAGHPGAQTQQTNNGNTITVQSPPGGKCTLKKIFPSWLSDEIFSTRFVIYSTILVFSVLVTKKVCTNE